MNLNFAKYKNSRDLFSFHKFYFLSGPRPRRIRCPLGCYKDFGKRILPKAFINISRNTPVKCSNHCKKEGYPLSGVQYRTQCFCGRRLPARAFLINPGRCNMKCPGNKNKRCGGSWAMNVTRTRTGKSAKCLNFNFMYFQFS